jgi:hypothetical protein
MRWDRSARVAALDRLSDLIEPTSSLSGTSSLRSARTADGLVVLAPPGHRVGVDRGKILENRVLRGKRLYSVDCSDKLWLPEHLSVMRSVAAPELQLALTLALYSGQRQGDLLRLSRSTGWPYT